MSFVQVSLKTAKWTAEWANSKCVNEEPKLFETGKVRKVLNIQDK